jgi:hypothetical protein
VLGALSFLMQQAQIFFMVKSSLVELAITLIKWLLVQAKFVTMATLYPIQVLS